ncbi:uncharacterized protein METZ01_LOCUS217536 [marine metagenome]|uniref:Uncharacterized protein n=1 Tax=marine metagenome TaxID=408172 RepID=A0A382FPY3_9ZZZZ
MTDIVDCNGGNHSWSFKPHHNRDSRQYGFEWEDSMDVFSAIEICGECGKQRTSKYAYVSSEEESE